MSARMALFALVLRHLLYVSQPALSPAHAPPHTSGTAPSRRCRPNTVLGQIDTTPCTKLRDRLVDTAGATFCVRREMHAQIVVHVAEPVGADAAAVGFQRQVGGAAIPPVCVEHPFQVAGGAWCDGGVGRERGEGEGDGGCRPGEDKGR